MKFDQIPSREIQIGDILRDASGQEGEIVRVGFDLYELSVIQHNEREPGSIWTVHAHEFDDEDWTCRAAKSKSVEIEWEDD